MWIANKTTKKKEAAVAFHVSLILVIMAMQYRNEGELKFRAIAVNICRRYNQFSGTLRKEIRSADRYCTR